MIDVVVKKNSGFCILGLVFAMLAGQSSQAMVRSGNFLNVGSSVLKYVPEAFQGGDLQTHSSGRLSIEVESFTTHTGMERLTLVTYFRSVWDDVHLGSVDFLSLKNDLYFRVTANLSLGAGVDLFMVDAVDARFDSQRRGHQYGLLARLRW